MNLTEHAALVAKVDAHVGSIALRRAGALACHAGCASCCHTTLSVCDVEAEALRRALAALPTERREALRARAETPANEPVDVPAARCALLDDEGRCVAYDARPLVCRTQGHALRYPAGVIPPSALFARAPGGAGVTWCPLNYQGQEKPGPADVLDAERVDLMLALVNRRASGTPDARTALRDLARER